MKLIILLLAICMGLFACEKKISPSARAQQLIEQVELHVDDAVLVSGQASVYTIDNWRDPFLLSHNDSMVGLGQTKNSVTKYSLSDIQAVGFLQSNHGRYLLIALPNGVGFKLSVGNRVGLENAMVKNISLKGYVLHLKDKNGKEYDVEKTLGTRMA